MATSQYRSRRAFLSFAGTGLSGLALAACTASLPGAPATEPTAEAAVNSAAEALQRLKDGNQRYVANQTVDPNQSDTRRIAVSQGQQPFATILGCVDSRVPPELVFDRGLGDLFVIRTAGQVIDQAVLGSIEFGVDELKIPLIVVLGHSSCGAVNATLEALEANAQAQGAINYLVEGIAAAVATSEDHGDGDHLDAAVRANIAYGVSRLQSESALLATAVSEGRVQIVGARYDLASGLVEFL